MSVLVLGGPPASGHNTIAEQICGMRSRVVLIDLDDVREMVSGSPTAPGDQSEGDRIYLAAIDAGCAMARSFSSGGFDVVLVDVVPPETVARYRANLSGTRHSLVALIADVEELVRRDIARDPNPSPDPETLAQWHGRIRLLHEQISNALDDYDHVVRTETEPNAVATQLAELL